MLANRPWARYRQIYRCVWEIFPGLFALGLTHRWIMTAVGMRKWHVFQRNDGITSILGVCDLSGSRLSLKISLPAMLAANPQVPGSSPGLGVK